MCFFFPFFPNLFFFLYRFYQFVVVPTFFFPRLHDLVCICCNVFFFGSTNPLKLNDHSGGPATVPSPTARWRRRCHFKPAVRCQVASSILWTNCVHKNMSKMSYDKIAMIYGIINYIGTPQFFSKSIKIHVLFVFFADHPSIWSPSRPPISATPWSRRWRNSERWWTKLRTCGSEWVGPGPVAPLATGCWMVLASCTCHGFFGHIHSNTVSRVKELTFGRWFWVFCGILWLMDVDGWVMDVFERFSWLIHELAKRFGNTKLHIPSFFGSKFEYVWIKNDQLRYQMSHLETEHMAM